MFKSIQWLIRFDEVRPVEGSLNWLFMYASWNIDELFVTDELPKIPIIKRHERDD